MKKLSKIVNTNDEVEKIVKIAIIYKLLYKNRLDKDIDVSNQYEFLNNVYNFYYSVSQISCSYYDQLNLNYFSIIESLYQLFNFTDDQKSILQDDNQEFIIKKKEKNDSNYIIKSKQKNCPNYEININNNSLFKIKVIFKEDNTYNNKYIKLHE